MSEHRCPEYNRPAMDKAVTREYRDCGMTNRCAECGHYISGGGYAVFEPWNDSHRVCGFLCQPCARNCDVPIWPKQKEPPTTPAAKPGRMVWVQ